MNETPLILVVDDDPLLRAATVRALVQAGYRTCQAIDGLTGLQMALEHKPALILLDVNLPDVSGIEVCNLIKTDPVLAGCFVVLLSGARIDSQSRVEGLDGGADGYVTRPVTNSELMARVRGMLRIQQSEQALRASEQRYRSILNASPDIISITDLDGRILLVSPAALTMFGYEREEQLLGHLIVDFMIPEDRDRAASNAIIMFQEAVLGRFAKQIGEYRGLRMDGNTFDVEVNGEFIRGADGQPKSIVFVVRDITERKHAENLAAQQSEQLRILYEASQRLNSTLDLGEIYQVICDVMSTIAPNDSFVISSFDHATQLITCRAFWMENNWLDISVFPPIPLSAEGEGTQSIAIRTGQAKLINDVQEQLKTAQNTYYVDPETNEVNQEIPPDEFLTRSALIVPLKIGGKVTGVLQVMSYRQNAYSENQLKLLEALALHIASAEQNALLYAQVQSELNERKHAEDLVRAQAARLEILASASQAFAAAGQDYQTVLEQVARKAAGALGDSCYIRLLSVDGEWLNLAVLYDADPEAVETASMLLTQAPERANEPGIVPRVFRTGQPAFIPFITLEQLRISNPPKLWPIYERFAIHSMIAVPLLVQERCIGVLGVNRYRSERPAFTDEDLRLAQDLGSRAALAINSARLFGQAQNEIIERKQVEKMLRESEASLKKAQATGKIGNWIYNLVDRVTWSDEMYRLFEVLPDVFIPTAESFINLIHPDDRDAMQTWIEACAAEETPGDLEFRAILAGGAIRYINGRGELIYSADGRPIHMSGTAQDITERKQAEENLNRRLAELESLRIVDQAITSSFDLHSTIAVLLEQAMAHLKADAVAVLLHQPLLHSLEYFAGRGFHSRRVEDIHMRLGEGFAGHAVLEHRAIQVSDPIPAQDNLQISALWESEGFLSYFATPLVVQGETKGVLEVFHRTRLDANLGGRGFLNTLADQAAIAIANAQLFEGLQRANMDLGLAYDATIEGWSRAMDLRDKETEGHTQRVTEMTLRLARSLRVNESELVHIWRGALLHDMGKLGVPDHILLKPGKLTEAEWVIMRQHPQLAYDMLSPIAYLRSALDIPYCHHEKWDGSGYPRQLVGEQIPLAARLFAVVDVWDALTSDRPYRKKWTKQKTRQHILEQSGNHFDPRIVDIFMKYIEQEKG